MDKNMVGIKLYRNKDPLIDFFCKTSILLYVITLFSFYEIRLIAEFFCIFCLLIYCVKKGLVITTYTYWGIVFSLFCLLSTLWTVDLSDSLLGVRSILEMILVGSLIVNFANSKEKLEFLTWSFIIAGFFLCIRLMIVTPLNAWGNSRLGDEVYNANSIGLYIAISSLFAFYKSSKNKKYYVFILMFLVVVLASGSRKALFLIVGGIILYTIFNAEKPFKRNFSIVLSLFGAFVSYRAIMDIPELYNIMGVRVEGLMSAITGGSSIDASTRIRLQLIEIGKVLFASKPFLGYGINTFSSVSNTGIYAHNNYIELLVGIGAIGTSIYYSLYLYIIHSFLVKKKKRKLETMLLVIMILLLMIEYGLVSWSQEVYQLVIIFSMISIRLFKKDKLE